MSSKFLILVCAIASIMLQGCTKGSSKKEFWVYTSLYKDTIADLEPKLKTQFPDLDIKFFQAGSEDVAAKIGAEELAGGTKADVIIFSDRFWFEDMASKGRLHPYKSAVASGVPATLRHPDGFYATLSIPVMVMVYNNEAVKEKEAPTTFKEMADLKWKAKFTTGSPLASGTNFTTVAFLQKAYGWDYFKALKKNDTISEGGNSSVIRRVQNKERPIGWVLLENVLRIVDQDPRIKVVFPQDGAVIQSNVIAIVKKTGSVNAAEKFVDWMYGKDGQDAMIRSYMYSPLVGFAPPKGAPPLTEIMAKARPWSSEFLSETMKAREALKEEYTKIMFQ